MYALNLLFYLKKAKKNKAGEAPVYLRITLDGQRTELSIKRRINPDSWDADSQRARGRSEKARLLNNYIDEFENKLNRHYNLAIQEKHQVSAQYLKNLLTGNNHEKKLLIQVFEEYNKLIEREKGKKYSAIAVERYAHGFTHLKKYLKKEYNQDDIELVKLDIMFIQIKDAPKFNDPAEMLDTVMNEVFINATGKTFRIAVDFGYPPYHSERLILKKYVPFIEDTSIQVSKLIVPAKAYLMPAS